MNINILGGINILKIDQIIEMIVVFILLMPSISAFSYSPTTNEKTTDQEKWTILLYDDADFYNAFDPLQMILNNTGSTDDVNLLVLRDKEFDDANIYYINEEYQHEFQKNLGEVNMGDPSTLKNFIEYAKTHYPAERYLLTLYNHGGGWYGACWDQTNDSDNLEMDEIHQALHETGGIDIITFSACTMGCIESVYELRNDVQVYIGSEEQHGFGEYWLKIPGILDEFADESTNNIAKKIIDIYKQSYPYFGTLEDWTISLLIQKMMGIIPYPPALTISAIDTEKISLLTSSMDNLSQVLMDNFDLYKKTLTKARIRVEDYSRPMTLRSPFGTSIDILDFVNLIDKLEFRETTPELHEVIENIKRYHEQIIVDEHHQIGHRRSNGLSIYYPPQINPLSIKNYDGLYSKSNLDFTDDTHWDEFLELLNGNNQEENDTYVDQSQLVMETASILCDDFTWAQSFIPAKDSITKISIPLIKRGIMFTKVELSIRKDLSGNDLVICSKASRDIPNTGSLLNGDWLTFDIDDVSLEIGETYYLVCKTRSGDRRFNHYSWLCSVDDEYSEGESWLSNTLGESWHSWYDLNNVSFDFCFKTYYL